MKIDFVKEIDFYKMSSGDLAVLWTKCADLLRYWQDIDFEISKNAQEILKHSESFLVAYSMLLCYELIRKGENPNPKMIREMLSFRYNEEEINKFLILGKDISKRGIPIYKNLI